MYRWVSSARPQTKLEGGSGENVPSERVMTLSFSVPVAVLPQKETDENAMAVDGASAPAKAPPRLPPVTPPTCDVQGCTAVRKYRLVRDFQKGACGMGHLKVLEAQFA